MNHEDTKAKRLHEDYFVLLSAFESLWFKFKLTRYIHKLLKRYLLSILCQPLLKILQLRI
jgi:hypothetical protein